ncbi:hypothetical protein FA95DRAFT_1564759 [Auriscalpium vulgare]|uniref:Uncharacterized protein n=1 Tax=Auriscalpium vulgare TaxID=40419 RepID=A0ACB8REI9_9AGAM|nr:hypothetical protein FA95DRAFT_1564759 [Auriscalpium vulgare]
MDVCSVTPPTSDIVLDFVRRSIAAPEPSYTPALPSSLQVATIFTPHAAVLAPFLSALPAPFTYNIDTPEAAHGQALSYIMLAEGAQRLAKQALAERDGAFALRVYDEAVGLLEEVVMLGHGAALLARGRRMLAACLAGCASAYMLRGAGHDAAAALRCGQAAERADRAYMQAYLRQARAHRLLGDVGAARRVLERAARRARGSDVHVIESALAALQK